MAKISIHASREGSDMHDFQRLFSFKKFQSTLPAREATWACASRPSTPGNFNPRFPRGKRRIHGQSGLRDASISIHASREGSDSRFLKSVPPFPISIHASREGSDYVFDKSKYQKAKFQSTLPAREATYVVRNGRSLSADFNPRFPRGKRQSFSCL